jgi:hypothetical protein
MNPLHRSARLAAALVATVALGLVAFAPASAQAAFGFLPGAAGFDVNAYQDGNVEASLAGSHPDSVVTEINFNQSGGFADGDLKDLTLDLPPGLIENSNAVPRCTAAQFSTPRVSPHEESASGESCSGNAQIGVVTLIAGGGKERSFGVFNLVPPPGFPAEWGFSPYGVPITVSPRIRETPTEYGISVDLKNFSQQLSVVGLRLEIWGVPWALRHNYQRGNCLDETNPELGWGKCSAGEFEPEHVTEAYLTLPTDCATPMTFHVSATSWQQPGTIEASSTAPRALGGCAEIPFQPVPVARLSTDRASTATGFDFTLDGSSKGLLTPGARAPSQVKKAVVRLPEGMTINPSVASGLGTCSEAQFAAETVTSQPGEGCPNDAKIGELSLESPLVEGKLEGSLFFATPRENRFGTLLALYMVAKAPERGIMVRVAGRVDSDPATGQLVATFDNLPQIPYSNFHLHFREGQRSPLATPAACGTYATEIETSPWLDPSSVDRIPSEFQLVAGIEGTPCPNGPLAPFAPRSIGGTINSNAGSYSPFYLHLTRGDAEQEITSYSASFPPGMLGKIAGIPFCSDAQIEAAKHQTGAESALTPACPEASRIGRTYTGYGLGTTLAYAPGGLYLAGPYHGSPLSVVAIDSAKVGPFDLGTVVIRSAIRVNRQTAQVAIDSAGSDPIPHILDGFPLRLRDIRIYIDRPSFMVSPTSCDRFAVASTLTGSGLRFGDPADDSSFTSSSPFQVTNCSALGFAPRISLLLKGGHRRGDFPALQATVRPRVGDSNIGRATVTLPPKLFLAQEHLDTVCTPKQFNAHNCPSGSVYGHATAVTPLLEEPLSGPVYLRSNGSERVLPDLVAALSGRGVEIELLGKIDSHHGGLRARFDTIPDAPVTKFTMNLRGGKKGIIANATDTCANPQVATTRFVGQDNATRNLSVPVEATCKGKKGKGKKKPAKNGKGGK